MTTLGVWTRTQALELISRGTISSLIASGVWRVVFRGVYTDRGHILSPEQWAVAALLATGGATAPVEHAPPQIGGIPRRRFRAVAGGRTAARVWQLPLIDDDDPATGGTERFVHDVRAWRTRGSLIMPAALGDPRGHQLHRHQWVLFEGDVVRHANGIWLTSALRTALDCVPLLSHEAAVCVLDNGLHRKLFTTSDLQVALRARVQWPGVGAVRAAVAAADGRSESPNETLARLLLRPVLPGLVPQVAVCDRQGWVIARFDLGDKLLKLAVDMDGKRGHAGTHMVAKDRQRDRRTEAYGWWTERGTWFDVRRQPTQFRERVLARDAALRRRAA